MQQGLRLLRRVRLAAVAVAQPLGTGADRDQPVAAHLQLFVERLHRFVVEGVARLAVAGAPQQRLMRVGKAPAAEIRHRVGLAPHHVVEDPEPLILQRRADAEDIVITADDPERPRRLQQAPRGGEPALGKPVVFGEIGEFIPVVLDPVDPAVVGPMQLAAQLQVIRRVGEDEIDRPCRQVRHDPEAVALDHFIFKREIVGRHARNLRVCDESVNDLISLSLKTRFPSSCPDLFRASTEASVSSPWMAGTATDRARNWPAPRRRAAPARTSADGAR